SGQPTAQLAQITPVWRLERVTCDMDYPRSDRWPGNATFTSCWSGLGNGQVISVRTADSSLYKDPSQGMLMISSGVYYYGLGYDPAMYTTPIKVGTVRI